MPASLPLVVAFFLSGASGLVYEVVWARQLAVLVGGTAHASQAVLATFFAGLAAGAFLLGPAAARAGDGRRFYARLELGIAAAGVLSGVLLALAPPIAARLTDGSDGARTAAVALGTTLVVCLPATLLMGATFPALTRAIAHGFPDAPAETLLGRAYAANTVGAVLGSVLGAFALLPALGVRGTLVAAVLGNVAAAALALVGRPAREAPVAGRGGAPPMPRSLAAALLLSGFAAISLEIVALRVLAVTLLDTVYTFALAIAAYILGAAATARVVGRRQSDPRPVSPTTIVIAAAASALWLPALRLAAPIHAALAGDDAGFAATVLAEATVALLFAAPAAVPTTWLYLRLAAHPTVGGAAIGAGRATAWNGIGCMAAPLVSALVIMPWAGTTGVGVAAIAALIAAALAFGGVPRDVRAGAGLLAVATGVAVLVAQGGVHGWVATPGWRLIWKKEGASVAVSVEESPDGLRRLRTNNNFTEGGDAGGLSQIRQGLLPALLLPDASRALALGVGSGITLAGTVAGLSGARIDAVELIPEISRAVGFFARANGAIHDLPNVTLHVADARTFTAHAAARGHRYDLVVGELFHASQAGTGALYAAEHFQNVRRLLSPGRGVYCQWIPLHEAPPPEVKAVVRTFFRAFSHGAAYFGSWTMRTPILGLIGSEAPLRIEWDALERAVAAPPSRRARADASELARIPETIAAFIGDAAAMRRWAGEGPPNSDDRPTLELGAPRGAGRLLGPENVRALLPAWGPPDGIVHYGPAERRAEVVRVQTALFAFFRGNDAWLAGDLARAEEELRRAQATAPELRFIEPALRGLRATARSLDHSKQ